ncbi:Gfo/Idh/MocA family protein [Polynucleobacter paneuropaeus]|uniref:Gfo/Idh/MocA family protein n=1 Tax=Polynucleobacter paneuropaeus TaxID=2527775 RepID=UPI001BFE2D71|nr:Gfo/Idh/MocA family oxidoreductase [Polynucleobacter paneuropaeus]
MSEILSNKILRVLIIGCGNIAGGFDEARGNFIHPYTHAGAYVKDGRFKIVACIDPDDAQREQFMARWGIPLGVKRVEDLVALNLVVDVVSICSPTICHPKDIEMALMLTPKLIFCEKPISLDYSTSEAIVRKCKEAQTLLMINYTRRWDPMVVDLRQDIALGKRGELRNIAAIYNKGIFNNGSHMIDLLNFILGPLKVISASNGVYDFFQDDPSIPVKLESHTGVSVTLSCADARDFSMFECQFIFSKGVVSMENGGLFWRSRKMKNSSEFPGYRELDEGARVKGEYSQAMLYAVNNLYLAVTKGAKLDSTGESALLAQKLCHEVLNTSINR